MHRRFVGVLPGDGECNRFPTSRPQRYGIFLCQRSRCTHRSSVLFHILHSVVQNGAVRQLFLAVLADHHPQPLQLPSTGAAAEPVGSKAPMTADSTVDSPNKAPPCDRGPLWPKGCRIYRD